MALSAATLVIAACGGGDDAEPTTTGQPPPQRSDEPPPEPEPTTGDGTGGVKLTEIGGFEQPLYVTQPPHGDDALYVVEQAGRVMRVPAEGEPEVFLDLSGEVSCCGEQGLLSIAFAPDHRRSGLLYASFTNPDGDSRIVEYRAKAGDEADPSSAREVLAIDQPYPNHNGGLILFGPDDALYAGFGDGGSAGDPERNAQDPSSLLGKLLRLDPTGGGRPLIAALGLRNPWRFSFDRDTDDLWIGDVGQSSLEEIDAVRFGSLDDGSLNFGWSAFEGTERFNADQEAQGQIPPVLTYGRDRGCSVTGGYVVRDPRLQSLYGRYLYGDYCEGELRSFPARAGRRATDDVALGPQVPGLSSFGEDRAGHLYATSIEGAVYRLDPSG